ncbi:MAG TPA: hypothetical protein VEY92_03630 [Pseudoxanthomonas sp.]|nr:hypothetical protein [Pseudoxanthomonas sp.]
MTSPDPTFFDWVELLGFRARFSGCVRGADEQGHHIFSVEVNGREYFGEIQRAFLPNGNDYNIEVVSFGYGKTEDFGIPMLDACQAFTLEEISTIQALVGKLIEAGRRFKRSLLTEYPNAHFMGQVIFRDGWVLARDEASS